MAATASQQRQNGRQPHAAGVLLVHDGRVLLLRRSPGGDAGDCWAAAGGKIEAGETPAQAAVRELREETGLAYTGPLLDLGVAANGFQTFAARVDAAHAPTLNEEHTAAAWAPFEQLPEPLHPHMAAHLLQVGLPDRLRRLAAALA